MGRPRFQRWSEPNIEGKLTVPRYRTPSFQATYDAMLSAARDPSSELYHDGYGGLAKTANVIPGTLSAGCYAAGKEFARTNPGIAFEDAVWTPGVTRKGGSIV